MGKINLLSFEVANLIAAGEVVDRPASAVKELLENAVDSGAEHIILEIQRGGVSFIRVADDGCGIEKDDLVPAITRHSTSKIKTAADLSSIMTLGFRGEALAAIASVSRLRIYSKTADKSMGAFLEAEAGRVIDISDTGCRAGTTIVVEDLFYNVPARRKFLKKDSTEAIAIGAVIEKIALSHPEISFKFLSDGEVKFMTSGKGDLRETVWALFGRETAARSLVCDREENGIRVTGLVSEPDLYRSNRNMENFFINGRYIKSKTASAAIEQAYQSKIPAEKFPFCVLNIELNPEAVDVNVHPAKLEVKFADEKLIFDAVYYAVLSALEAMPIRPELQLKKAARIEKAQEAPPKTTLESAYEPSRTAVQLPKTAPTVSGMTADEIKNVFAPIDRRNERAEQITIPSRPAAEDVKSEAVQKPIVPQKPFGENPYSDIDSFDPRNIPDYVIIGEAFNCYVIVEIGEIILMIDKHAAHERIIFDELCRKMHARLRGELGKKGGQMLLMPTELELLASEVDAVNDNRDKIFSLGFDYECEQVGASSFKVKISAIPEDLDQSAAIELFTTLASRLSEKAASVESASAGFFETRLWQASCKAALKGGRIYDRGHIKWICDRLLQAPVDGKSVIRTCPHGRPVAFEIKKSSIDRQFARLV